MPSLRENNRPPRSIVFFGFFPSFPSLCVTFSFPLASFLFYYRCKNRWRATYHRRAVSTTTMGGKQRGMSRYVVRRPAVYRWGLVSWFQWRATLVPATPRKGESTSVLSTVVSRSRAGNFLLFVAFRALFFSLFFFPPASLFFFSFPSRRSVSSRSFLHVCTSKSAPSFPRRGNRDNLRSDQ